MIDIKFDSEKLINSLSKYLDAQTHIAYFNVALMIILLIGIGLLFKDLFDFVNIVF